MSTTKSNTTIEHISAEDFSVDYVGILAKLSLTDEERQKAGEDMAGMIAYIDKLRELNTEDVEPLTHLFPVNNVFREDVAEGDYTAEEMLSNAPLIKENMFVVPRTIDGA